MTAPVKLTKAQRRLLSIAVNNRGEIQIGGADGEPGIRADVADRCYDAGWLAWNPPGAFARCAYRITDAGRRALAKGGGS